MAERCGEWSYVLIKIKDCDRYDEEKGRWVQRKLGAGLAAKKITGILFLLALTAGQVFSQRNIRSGGADFNHAYALFLKKDYNASLVACEKNIPLAEVNQHPLFLWLKGKNLLVTGQLDSAKIYLERALVEGYRLNQGDAICNAVCDLGRYYSRADNHKTAVKYFFLLSYYAKKYNDQENDFKADYYLSMNYNMVDAYAVSLPFAKSAYYKAIALGDTAYIISSMIGLGSTFGAMDISDSCKHYFLAAEKINDQFRSTEQAASIYNSLGKVALSTADYNATVYYGKKAVAATLAGGKEMDLNVYYDNIAYGYREMNQLDSAAVYLKKALALTEKYGFRQEYRTDLVELSRLYQRLGNTPIALYYFDKLCLLDSLAVSDNGALIDSLRNNFELQNNRIELKAKEEKMMELYRQQRKYYFIVSIIIILLFLSLFVIFYMRARLASERESKQISLQLKDSEIKALQAQMNPHFIFNCLNSVLENIRNNEREKAILYLTKFSRLIRILLEKSGHKSISLEHELEFLRLYLDMESLRFSNNFSYDFKLDKTLEHAELELPFLIIQPFLENSILHGVQNKQKICAENGVPYAGRIHLEISRQQDHLLCTIEDNGIGRKVAMEIRNRKNPEHISTGLHITRERLNLYGANNFQVQFTDLTDAHNQASGTKVTILIPLIEHF